MYMDTVEKTIEPDISATLPASSRKTTSPVVWVILFIVCIFGSFRYGLVQGQKGFAFQPKEFRVVNQEDQPKDVDYGLLWQALQVVNDKYIEKPIDQEKALIGATKGAVAAVGDQYTQYFDKKDLESFRSELKGSFFGIGAEIGKKNDTIVIVAPLDDSPAQKAGLLPGDFVVQVNGESTAGWSTDQAVTKIRGDKGTPVTLTIFREGKTKTFDLKIIRDEIKIKSVKWETKGFNGKKIGVIKLSRFGDDTTDLFNNAVKDLRNQNVQGLVLDLRSDPGGYLQSAVDVAGHWLSTGTLVVTEAHSNGTNIPYNSPGYSDLNGLKTIILINNGSASASEILAGALHDHGVATLLGEKSFGKGSVQELVELPQGGAVKVTVAKWITPKGVNLNKDGLKPDIEVKLTEEDTTNKKDPQMDKALEEVVK